MTNNKIVRRKAYSLVDVVTVTGCMSLFLVMLVPAVLLARDQSRSSVCKNRLRQISLALHNYQSTYRTFPPGWVSPQRDAESKAAYGWQFMILPYLDQAPLFNIYDMRQSLPAPDERLSMALEVYQCPQETGASAKNMFRGGYGRSSFSGNMGDVAPIRWSDGRVESFWPGAVPTFHCARIDQADTGRSEPNSAATVENSMTRTTNGMFGWNTKVGIRDVVDGTSHTFAVGERSQISGSGIWAGVGANRFENDALTDVSDRSLLNKSLTGFSSSHEGGAFFVMVDGSVRFLADTVDSKPEGGVFQHLGNRMDRSVIPENAFSEN